MSAVCVLTPIVIAAWPAFSAAVVAAATSLGYQVGAAATQKLDVTVEEDKPRRVQLEIEQSELVMDQLGRDQHISVTREGVTVTFSRDTRGRASLCVTGTGQTAEELRALGKELGKRVVQQYVYQRLMDEIRARQFVVVEEEVDETHAIRLKARHWEN
jgi:formylmethanofuran dehydrogenase subunit E